MATVPNRWNIAGLSFKDDQYISNDPATQQQWQKLTLQQKYLQLNSPTIQSNECLGNNAAYSWLAYQMKHQENKPHYRPQQLQRTCSFFAK